MDPIRVVRIIARLNIGGPAIQAITLTKRLEDYGYVTTLVRGQEEPDEGNMDHLAEELGVRPVRVPALRRNPGWYDLAALVALIRIVRRVRPHIVHTHAAKGGTLGRVATLIAFPLPWRRPVVFHTFHGHSLSGYFSDSTTAAYRRIEQVLAWFTNRLIAVSIEVRDELVAMGVAPEAKFEVVPLGFDLAPFTVNTAARLRAREALRCELGIPPDAKVVTLVARLVPIKRVDRFLRIADSLRSIPGVWFVVVGGGELAQSLRSSADALSLGDRLIWAGFRRDMPAVYFASEIVVQTSDNEGTPVALIEAQAAGVPVVSTRVGGSATAVAGDKTSFLADPEDEEGLARAARALLVDRDLSREIGAMAHRYVTQYFHVDRLVADVARLYRTVGRPGERRPAKPWWILRRLRQLSSARTSVCPARWRKT